LASRTRCSWHDDLYDQGNASPAPASVEQQSADDAAAHSDSGTRELENYGSEPPIASAGTNRSISISWSPPVAQCRKGVVPLPASHDLDSRDRDTLLAAIAKARSWMDDLINGRVQSFDEIADRERKVARHIRFLAPLAFLSPRIVASIANGDVPTGATVSGGSFVLCLSIGRSRSGDSLCTELSKIPTSALILTRRRPAEFPA
jgi:hypothetical protein